jgi:Domain of unknown function (DUF4864)
MRALVLLIVCWIGFAAPGRAEDDVAAAQAVISSQVEAIGRDDAVAAYAFATPGIHSIIADAKAFLGIVREHYGPVYRHKGFRFGDASASDGKIAQEVHIIDADGVPWEALYTLERQPDGSIKISGCVLVRAPGVPV